MAYITTRAVRRKRGGNFKLAVVFIDNYHRSGSKVAGREPGQAPLTYFKNNTLRRCYELINTRWAGKVAYAAIYDQQAPVDSAPVAEFTAEKQWNK